MKEIIHKIKYVANIVSLPKEKKQYHNSDDPTKQVVSCNQMLMYSYINKNTKNISAVQCKFVSLVESYELFNYIYMYVLL